jgi:heat shock protein HslJ
MTRFPLLLPLLLAACASAPAPLPPPDAEVRPVVAQDRLEGRWTITAVNGRPVSRLFLELGAEGLPVVERRADGGMNIGRPGPATIAMLGCNKLRLNGWTRNGDKLMLGIDGSTKTEMGCDPATMAAEEQTHAILRRPMTMEFTPPARLRLINEAGTLELVRYQGVG